MSPRRATWLAWRQLAAQPTKLLAATAGVVFAVVLMFMQLGFREAAFDAATSIHRRLKGELFLVHARTESLPYAVPFARRRVDQALGVPGVVSAHAVRVGLGRWKSPWSGTRRLLLVVGLDPTADLLDLDGLDAAARARLTREDAALFDEVSREEFGPVARLLRAGTADTVRAEVEGRRLDVAGLFRLGASFAADGNLLTSELDFSRRFPGRSLGQADVGVLGLAPGADVLRLQATLGQLLPQDVRVLTKEQLVAAEKRYWDEVTPIGYVFALGTALGFVVGVVVVYQILHTEVTAHLPQYATLLAIGHSRAALAEIVAAAATLLAVVGFLPGLGLSLVLYDVCAKATFLPMVLGPGRAAGVGGLTLGMCLLSGVLALRKLSQADPADVF